MDRFKFILAQIKCLNAFLYKKIFYKWKIEKLNGYRKVLEKKIIKTFSKKKKKSRLNFVIKN